MEELRVQREAGKERGGAEKAGAAGAGRGSEQEEVERETGARAAALGWSGAVVSGEVAAFPLEPQWKP